MQQQEWIKNSILYNALFALGDVISMELAVNHIACLSELREFDCYWQQYNPRLVNPRYGLPYTSLDGNVVEPVGLDSIRQYNNLHGTNYTESSFDKLTDVANKITSLHHIKDFFGENLKRSHFLKLETGGFFPIHRDSLTFMHFRVLIPIKFIEGGHFFILENKPIPFINGRVYIVNTLKDHVVFNASPDPMILLVLNISLDENTLYKWIRGTLAK